MTAVASLALLRALRAAATGYSRATRPSLGGCLRDSSSSVVVSVSCQFLFSGMVVLPPGVVIMASGKFPRYGLPGSCRDTATWAAADDGSTRT